MTIKSATDRYTGALLALACGDALGAPAEFLSKEALLDRFGRLTDMVGGGSFGWAPGEWTDDTGMTLCIAEGILEAPDDPVSEVGRRFLEWSRTAKDVGGTISAALNRFEGDWAKASRGTPQARQGKAAGNGSLMRTLPVALAYPDRERMLTMSARLSAMTHWDPQAELACAIYCLWIRGMLRGLGRDEAWGRALADSRLVAGEGRRTDDSPGPGPVPDQFWARLESAPLKNQREIQPSGYAGYVIDCLEAVVWCCHRERLAEDVLVRAVNLAGETDTIAAICGGVVGTDHGSGDLPGKWLEVLHQRQRLGQVGCSLARLRHDLVYSRPNLPAFVVYEASPGLWAGRNPLTEIDIELLQTMGVDTIVDLREEVEWSVGDRFGAEAVAVQERGEIERIHLPVIDAAPVGEEVLDRAFRVLSEIESGRRVYVHCRAGIERTGAVLVGFMARREGHSYDEALKLLVESGCPVDPLKGQERVVREWLANSA